MWVFLSAVIIISIVSVIYVYRPRFGRLPQGERLQRIERSPNYHDGQFRNITSTTLMASERPKLKAMRDFLLRKTDGLRPHANIPSIKTDLREIRDDEDIVLWLGHSSVFIQQNGKRFLVDPVFAMASPVSFINTNFKGTNIYTAEDMPEIDYLLITHDHWDHLDYTTVMSLKDRIGKIVCGLGVGEHFEYWGFDDDKIIELDWNENAQLDGVGTVNCLPARHFSGRGLSPNRTLWVSYMLQTPGRNIFISGDTGYGDHFREISRQVPKIDLAIMENGQYNENWKYIHMMPSDLERAIGDLKAAKILTVHNSKYALSTHPWQDPLAKISTAATRDSLPLVTPMIGEVVYLNDSTQVQVFNRWWENCQ